VPDEISVRLAALTDGFTNDMKQAGEVVQTAGDQMAGGMARANHSTESLMGTLVKGREGRHLRLMALELGSLAGEGTTAARSMFSLLGSAQALEEGLGTMGGAVGLAVAGIGLAITAFVAWTEHTKKQAEEQHKLNEEVRKFHEGALVATNSLRDWLAAGHELPAWLQATSAGLDRSFSAQHRTMIDDIKEKIRDLNDDTVKHTENTYKNATAINALNLDMLFLIRTGLTFTEWQKKEIDNEKKLADAIALRARMTLSGAQADVNAIEMLERWDKKQAATLATMEQGYEQFSKSVGATLVSLANSHENFGKAVVREAIRRGEEILASKAILAFLTLLTGGGAGGLFAAAGALQGTTSALSLAELAAETAARQGNTALGPAH